jgi:hypothetical protein
MGAVKKTGKPLNVVHLQTTRGDARQVFIATIDVDTFL